MVQFDDKQQQKTLAKLRKQEQERLSQNLSSDYDLPYIDLTSKFISGKALRLLSKDEAKKAQVAPFRLVDKKLYLAVYSPDQDSTQQIIEQLESEGYTVELYMASLTSLEKAWEMYDDISRSRTQQSGTVNISDENVSAFTADVTNVDDVKGAIEQTVDTADQASTTTLIELLLAGAIATNASDIHLEPEKESVRVRFRIDGVLVTAHTINHSLFDSITQRIKLVSGMKLNVDNEAQDGRFTIEIDDRAIEIRSSVVPGPYGEGVVMRLLDPNSIQVTLEELGIHPRLLDVFKEQIRKPHGMILNTGPTGSGKTTTLYSFLREVNDPQVKILTIENPIEYHLDGIVQTQVDRTADYTFLEGLRSALRQDPDVIMVGEIREDETANVAINAALTGHLVFSTLHTNDAAGSFPRLIDLGVDPKVISSAVNMSMAQRLVRKLCPACKTTREPSQEERGIIETVLEGIKERDESYLDDVSLDTLAEANGCSECNNTGYQGRIGIFEAILSDKNLEEVLNETPSIRQIWDATKEQGILSMQQDGVLKVLDGTTSLEELGRVVDLDASK